jgi:mannosyltransferase
MLGKVDAVHGLYYMLVKSLTDEFGISEISLRLPSIAAAALAAAALAAAGRRLGGPRVGLVSAVFLVLLPRIQFAGTDARSYSFTVLGAALCVLFVSRFRDGVRSRDAIGFGAAAAMSTGFSFYCVLLVPIALLAALFDARLRPHWWKLALAGLPSGAVAAGIATIASHQTFQVAWIPAIDWHVAREVLFLQYFSHAAMWPDAGGMVPSSGLQLVAGMIITAAVVVPLAIWGALRPQRTLATALGATLVCLPPAVLVVGSALMGSSFYLPRYLTFTAPGVCLLAALAFDSLLRLRAARWVAAVAVIGLVSGSCLAITGQRTENGRSPSDDFRFVATTIRDHAARGDAFAVAQGEDLFLAAYPEPFEGLVDLTRGISAAEWGLIFNQRFPLDSRSALVDEQKVIWSITPVGKADDVRFLAAQGFAEKGRWTGTGHVIVKFVRP